MAVGATAAVTKDTLNAQLGAALQAVVNGLDQISHINDVWVSANNGSAGLQALGMTSDDANNYLAAVYEAVKLRDVMMGTATVASNGTVTQNTTGHNFHGSFKPSLGTGVY